MILKAKHSKVYLCCEDEVSGSGSTRPDTNSAPVSIRSFFASIPVLSFLLVLIFDYPFSSAHQEPGIKAHMLNRVSFHPITRAKRPQAF